MSFKKVYKNYVNETDPQKKMSHLDAISQFFDNYQNSWLHIISGIVFFLSNSIFLLVVYHFLGGTIVTDGKIAKYAM